MIESIENLSGKREWGGGGGLPGGIEGFERTLKEGISLCRRGGGGCKGIGPNAHNYHLRNFNFQTQR